LSCVWYEQRSTCRDWIAFWRRQVFRLNDKASAQLLIGTAAGIGEYGLLGGATLLGSSHRTNHPKSQCSRCDCTKNASHEVLPVSPSHENPPDSDGSKNASTISIGSDLANLGLWSARSHRMRRAALLHPAARAASGHATAAPPSMAKIFVARCSLPCDPPVGVIHAIEG